jgi:hypothetical protein
VRRVIWLFAAAACGAEVSHDIDLRHANLRVGFQTHPDQIAMFEHDLDVPYDVLGDVEVVMRQRTAFGEKPTREDALRALRENAGRLGAHAVILVSFGQAASSMWSYNELQGHGRAVRFR